jgi:SAM-dependent methyltransferase
MTAAERGAIERLGATDIYLLDQLMRGRIVPGMRLLDAGCGGGRNLVYFLAEGYFVMGVDHNPECIARVRELAASVSPGYPPERFRLERIEELSIDDAGVDVVIASAVLHFARDPSGFDRMVDQLWRALAPGGLLFARQASSIGIESQIEPHGRGWYELPDGSERFLVDVETLERSTERLGGELADPIKTTLVHELRAMTTWVVRKPG